MRCRFAGTCFANPCHLEDASMIYEVRTYTLRPGTLAEFEERYEKRLPLREKTLQIGGLLAHRIRSAQSGHPRLSLRRPATSNASAHRNGARRRAQRDARRRGVRRRAGSRLDLCSLSGYSGATSTSNSTNVRLTRGKSTLFQWLAVPLWVPTGKDSVPTDSGGH